MESLHNFLTKSTEVTVRRMLRRRAFQFLLPFRPYAVYDSAEVGGLTWCFLQLRGFLNEVLLDQIPSLMDLQRYLSQLSVMEAPAMKREILLEQVGVI